MYTFEEMTTEIRAWAVEKGWRGDAAPPRELMEDVALMHSEAAEALEAYRIRGMRRWVNGSHGLDLLLDDECDYEPFKPEGVASELADVFIRLLDNAAEQSIVIDIGDPNSKVVSVFEKYIDKPFPFHIALLHSVIDSVAETIIRGGNRVSYNLNDVAIAVEWISKRYGFDLHEEIKAKMKYNWTRTFRHGGKLT